MKHLRVRAALALLLALCFVLVGCDLGALDNQATTIELVSTDPTPFPSKEADIPPVADPSAPAKSSFAIHFIDVGQADAALIICDGRAMLIDGGNSADSSLIFTYLKKQNIKHLDYIVATHAHEDHIGGLPAALEAATFGLVYSPVRTASNAYFNTLSQKLKAQGRAFTIPTVGETVSLGSAQVTFLGPLRTDYEDPNDTSIVLRVVYGETSFLFTGDMESLAEGELLDAGTQLQSTLLKVGHHGSRSSTSYPFLRAVAPEYAVICVGADNDYGHPTMDVLSRLRDAEVEVYRTDMQGDILCTSDGKELTFQTAKVANGSTNPTIGNRTAQ